MSRFAAFSRLDQTRQFVLRGSLLSVVLRVVGVLLGYLSHVLISRLLGLHGYGIYVVALGWALVLTLPARLGFDQSALRYATVYLESGQAGGLRGFIRVAVASVTLASIVISGAFVLFGSLAGVASLAVLISAALIILPQALLGILSIVIRTARRIFASQFYDQLLRPGLLIVFLAGFALAGRAIDPAGALALSALAAFVALAALTVHFWRIFASARSAHGDHSDARQWFAVSMPLLMITFMQELLNQLEIILLGFFDAREAGLFAAAWRLASLVIFALATFGIVSGPVVASAYHRQDAAELNRTVHFAARLATAVAVIVILILVVAGKMLLRLFGSEFEAAYPALLGLLAGGLVNAFTGVVAYLLTLTGRERVAMIIFGGALLLSLCLNLLLIPRFGAVGAAIASSTALVVWNLAMVIYVRKAMGIDATALARPPRQGPPSGVR